MLKMLIKEYMDKFGFTVTDMSLFCRVSRTCIYRALNGHKLSLKLARRIYKKTKGEVKLNEDIPQI